MTYLSFSKVLSDVYIEGGRNRTVQKTGEIIQAKFSTSLDTSSPGTAHGIALHFDQQDVQLIANPDPAGETISTIIDSATPLENQSFSLSDTNPLYLVGLVSGPTINNTYQSLGIDGLYVVFTVDSATLYPSSGTPCLNANYHTPLTAIQNTKSPLITGNCTVIGTTGELKITYTATLVQTKSALHIMRQVNQYPPPSSTATNKIWLSGTPSSLVTTFPPHITDILPTPACTFSSSNYNIPLDGFNASSFLPPDYATSSVPVNFSIICDWEQSVDVSFSANSTSVYDAKNSIFNTGNTTVGLQLLDNGVPFDLGTPISLGSFVKYSSSTATGHECSARYKQLGSSVIPGTANATINITISYN